MSDYTPKILNEPALEITNLRDVQSVEVKWLWKNLIPFGKITIIQADPGDGKTTLALNLIAKLSKGEMLPFEETAMPPMVCIFQSSEDGVDDTIKPRLEKAGADCSKVVIINEDKKSLSLNDVRIEQAIRSQNAKVMILDPLQDYIGKIDMNRANESRSVMKPLIEVAKRTCCAIILISHLNKGDGKALYRAIGSIDFVACARSVLMVVRHPKEQYKRGLVQIKNNLGVESQPIEFELDPQRGFNFLDISEFSREQWLNGTLGVSKTDEAVTFLKAEFQGRESIPSKELEQNARNLGISVDSLKRAKKVLKTEQKQMDKVWYTIFKPKNQHQV